MLVGGESGQGQDRVRTGSGKVRKGPERSGQGQDRVRTGSGLSVSLGPLEGGDGASPGTAMTSPSCCRVWHVTV